MERWLLGVIWLVMAGASVALLLGARRRARAAERLAGESGVAVELVEEPPALLQRSLLLPLFAGLFAGAIFLLLRFQLAFVAAAALISGMLALQVVGLLAERAAARLENQLADAIDLMIGALGAGASLGNAIEAAVVEARAPLKVLLQDLSARIRLGDNPADVFQSLARRVPLESFLLFSSALAVHWEAGGQLSFTLSSVGRTLRDRMDVARRLQSSAAQSRFSAFSVLALTWFIALIVYNNNPEQMSEFVNSTLGSWGIAATTILQAFGIVWMNVISRPRF
ncbi:MAG: type II secretion system F family protein [Planctomycetaceae bacterium]